MTVKAKRNYKVIVEIELAVPKLYRPDHDGPIDPQEAASDIVHAIWEAGDPEDESNAILWVRSIEALTTEEAEDVRVWRCETCDVIAVPAPGHACWDAGHPHVVVKLDERETDG